jgi:hypothetical protein
MQEPTKTEDSEQSEAAIRTLSTTGVKKRKQKIVKSNELILVIVFTAIIALVLTVLINKLSVKHDVTNAQVISTKVIADISKRDGNAIWALGSPSFQRQYTPADLTQGFQAVEIATLKTPTLEQDTVNDASGGHDIDFIYEYTALKVPFYVKVGVEQRSNHWYLTSISGNEDESEL